MDHFAEEGIAVTALAAAAASPALRRIIDRLLDRTEGLIAAARALPSQIAAPGLRRESAVIVALAARLLRRLRRGDPVAARVGLTKADFLAAFLTGVCRGRAA
jgi:hypothetical protein